jgi:Zn-dependent metalloprotease
MSLRLWIAAGLVASVIGTGPVRAVAAQVDTSTLDIRRSGPHGLATFVTAKTPPGLANRAAAPGARQTIPVNIPRARGRFTGLAFWDQYGSLFGVADPVNQLTVEDVDVDPVGEVHTTYQQVHQGVPVFTGVLKLHQDAAGQVLAANGRFYPIKSTFDTKPTIDELAAQKIARAELAFNANPIVEDSELVIVDPGWYGDAPLGPRLAYRIVLTDLDAGIRESFFVNAHSGSILDHWSLIEQLLNRAVHNANQTSAVPGPLARGEGAPAVADADVNKAYDFAGDFYDFLYRAFGRDSIDNSGFILRCTVNSRSTGCPNAYWNGFQTVYCTGVVTDDIVAHELCHGLTGATARLIYQNQSGQLNESFSDVIGELVDLYNGDASVAGSPAGTPWPSISPSAPGTDTPNNIRTACSPRPSHPDGVRWLIGEDSAGFGGALRDMAMPTCIGDPDTASSPFMICQPIDAGGVHHGSAIPNKAFTLIVDGGSFNGHTVVGIGTIKAGAIWYRALITYLTPASDFKDAYDALLQSAVDLLGVAPNDPRTGLPSASTISAFDVQQLTEALQAVELNTDGACGQADNVLDESTPIECVNARIVFSESFDAGAPGWTVSNSAPPTPYNWVLTTTPLPYGRPGAAFFCADLTTGNCAGLGETATHIATTPLIGMPPGSDKPMLAFTHYLSTEGRFDGGRIEISVAGGPWTPITRQSFEFNPYNSVLMATTFGNTNPFAGSDTFSGTGGRWGRSIIDLSSYAVAGQNIQLRWVFSKDSCDGDIGWYIDDVVVYTCPDCDGDSVPDIDQFVFRRSFPSAFNLGWQVNSNSTITSPPQASGPVKLELLAIGDYAGTEEAIDIYLNTVHQGLVFQLGGIDCASTPIRGSLIIPAATWNSFASSGAITITVAPTPFVSGGDCNGSSVGLRVQYLRPVADANSNFILDACDCPIISQSPQSQNVVHGQNASFSATAVGQSPLTYQWRQNGASLTDGPSPGGGVISGATTATLTITAAGPADAGSYDVVVTNPCGSLPSAAAALTVTPACPTVGTQPQPLTVDAGQNAIFTVIPGAAGTPPFTYQWRRNSANLADGPSPGGGVISGSATDTLTITAAGYTDAGNFDCIITNSCGNATSAGAQLTVNAVCPIVTVQPQPQSVTDGGNVSFTATAIGLAPFTYQWRLDGIDLANGPAAGGGTISGATTATLTITGAGNPDIGTGAPGGGYDVVITNSCGSATTATATLAVNPACPSITTQPQPVTIDAGQDAILSVIAGGTAPFTYQWRRNGSDLANGPSIGGGAISGATSATLTITSAGYLDSSNYDCIVTNACGNTTTAAAALTVNPICPVIIQQPQPQTITDGGDALFTAIAIGQAPFSYQWRFNATTLVDGPSAGGGTISGAATNSLSITGAGMLDAGTYELVIRNACGDATTIAALLTVNPACPTVVTQPDPVAIDAGQNAVFSVVAGGTAPFTYQWRRNGLDLPDGPTIGGGIVSGATSATLTITGAGYYDAANFDCLITNACGNTTTSLVSLTVSPICPIITQQPQPQIATDGGNVSFTVAAIGQATLTYQWRLAGINLTDGPAAGGGTISGAATDTLTITGVSFPDAAAGAYDVIVTNTCGNASSAAVSLTVNPACPTISAQPQPVAIDSGQNAAFSVTAGGTAPFTYQWRRNGVNLADGPSIGGGIISGSATDTLTITAAGYYDAADFDCIIANACPTPTTSSAASLTINPICPVITQPPAPQTTTDGGNASFSVTALGQATLTYQWRRSGVDLTDGPSIGGGVISGATSASLTITGLGIADAADYDVVVTNSCGPATSAAAALTVNPACPTMRDAAHALFAADIFDFLAAYFAADPRADFNQSGVVSVQDIFDYLAAYFAGCP